MIKKITVLLLSLLLLLAFTVSVSSGQDIYSYYDKGKELVRGGDWIKAINTWMSGRTMLMAEEKADPRIGIAFIELITRKKLNHFFVQACEMYLWGFSTEDYDRFSETFIEEANRILPLVRERDVDIWKDAIKKDVESLPYLIKKFWLDKDPTPTTPANERLLEHWERIVYAREEYIRGRNSAYNTDDRGLIYVKYGEPDVTNSRLLGNNDKELTFWITAADKRRDINSMFNTYPDVEIWTYGSLDLYSPVIYIFGKATGMPFHLYNGVEDFIPNKAFNNRFIMDIGRGLHPGTLIQLMLYDEMRLVDYKYETRYNEIANILSSPSFQNPKVLRGVRDRFKADDAHDPVKKDIPKEKS
ncbi:MAG: GWxTD domain-containing protein, partial [bacterium]|nr:GWxTD domain-containing protein [bacterium]